MLRVTAARWCHRHVKNQTTRTPNVTLLSFRVPSNNSDLKLWPAELYFRKLPRLSSDRKIYAPIVLINLYYFHLYVGDNRIFCFSWAILGYRTFLSDAYRCQETWNNRFSSPLLQKLNFGKIFAYRFTIDPNSKPNS